MIKSKLKKTAVAVCASLGLLGTVSQPMLVEAFPVTNPSMQGVNWSGGSFGWQPIHHTGSNNIRARVTGTAASNRALRMLVDFRVTGGSHTGESGNLWVYNTSDRTTTGRINAGETATGIHGGRGPSAISRTTTISRPR